MNRIMTAAATAGLGDHQESEQVNKHLEHDVVGVGCVMLLVAVPLAGAYFWWQIPDLLIASAVMALIGLVIVLLGWQQFRRGHWLVHHFEHGIVMERTKGPIVAAGYNEIRAELRTYQTPKDADNPACDHVLLRLDFPRAGSYVVAEPEHGSPQHLLRLAERCGADGPSPIDHKVSGRLLDDHPWK